MPGRTFDYVPRLVEANLHYRVADLPRPREVEVDLMTVGRWWYPGPVLDQGREGACVGFGCTAEALASPVRQKFRGSTGDDVARAVYRRAQMIDEWEGESYEGTSVRAGMLVGREYGWWKSFYWAKNVPELRAALEIGPVVVGVSWMSGMYETDGDAMVQTGGKVVGGHCLLVTGYSPRYGKYGQRFRWRNSWGPTYGRGGDGYITPYALNEILFAAGGECAVPSDR